MQKAQIYESSTSFWCSLQLLLLRLQQLQPLLLLLLLLLSDGGGVAEEQLSTATAGDWGSYRCCKKS